MIDRQIYVYIIVLLNPHTPHKKIRLNEKSDKSQIFVKVDWESQNGKHNKRSTIWHKMNNERALQYIRVQLHLFFYKQRGSGISPNLQDSKSTLMITDFKIFPIMLLRQMNLDALSV